MNETTFITEAKFDLFWGRRVYVKFLLKASDFYFRRSMNARKGHTSATKMPRAMTLSEATNVAARLVSVATGAIVMILTSARRTPTTARRERNAMIWTAALSAAAKAASSGIRSPKSARVSASFV